jgi:hypothetical protein
MLKTDLLVHVFIVFYTSHTFSSIHFRFKVNLRCFNVKETSAILYYGFKYR